VTYIGDLAFDGCTGLKTLQFARDALITELGSDPEVYCSIFRDTTSLESVTLPESITTIGAGVFENSGIASVVLPSKLESISEAAFKGCANLVEVDIPSTIEAVYASAFMDCTSLERATLEEGVELLGQDAFGNCVKLTYIKVPATVMHMGGNPFSNCVGITELDIAPENENFIKGTDGVLYDSNVRTVIFYPAYLEAENYAVPATVYEFAASAFMGSQLKSIVIPDTVKEIPDGCFGGSAKLETVTIPLSISRIGNAAFRNCVSLKSAVVPSTCTEIGASAFENCSSMQSFDFGKRNTALTIGEYMLSGTTALKSITAPEGVTVIPAYCFAGTGLESFTVPETIVDISAEGIFMGAASLKTVVFEGNIDYANNWLGMYAFKDCTSLQSITVPEGIDNLGKGYSYESSTFANCTSLKSVTLLSPDFKGIGYRAFENCTALETVTFNDALYTSASKLVGLGKSAFRNCSSLVNFKFPYNVAYNSSDYQAFENCTSLTGVITITGSKVQMGGGFLKNCTSITELHLSCLNYVYNTTYDEAGTSIFGAFSGNFAGWTEEQSIYFDTLSYTDLVSGSSYKKYFTPVSGATASNALLINCEAKVYDKDGNQVIYDSETGYITEVLDSNGEVIYTYGA
jgi:hypothetical protein